MSYLNTFRVGLQSNRKVKKENEYSLLVCVIKKKENRLKNGFNDS